MLKFYRILLLTLVAVFIASAAGIARYAADSCTQTRMYRQLAAQTEKIPDDAVSTGNDFLPQYQALYAQNSDLAGWIQIDGTNINYPVMQSKHDPDFYLMYNIDKPQERRKATGTGGIPPENIRLRRTLTTEYLQLSLCYGVRDRMSIETAGFTGWR